MTSNSRLCLDIQNPCEAPLPATRKFKQWVSCALSVANYEYDPHQQTELTIRIVDEQEGRELNHTYRQKNYATNVLSFPFEKPEGVDLALLGDLVICASIAKKEAREQGKSFESHWAHMVIHGTLHLLGLDHTNEDDANTMESLEIRAMKELNFDDPYHSRPEPTVKQET
jgi:probable rRNA maturation factor